MDVRDEIEAARSLAREGDMVAAIERLRRRAVTVSDPSPFYFEIGNLAKATGLLDEADQAYRSVLQHRPQSIEAATNLANTLAAKGQRRSATAILSNVMKAAPGHPMVEGSVCDMIAAQGQIEEAAACYTGLAERHPDYAVAHANLGEMLVRLGRHDEALVALDRAAGLAPGDAEIVLNRAFSKLALGQVESGLMDYEARLDPSLIEAPVRRNLHAPRWTGDSAIDGPVLVVCEQGLGDEIRFASLVPALVERVSSVALECDARLISLFERSLPGVTVVASHRHKDAKRPIFNYSHLSFEPTAWIEAGSLPLQLGLCDDSSFSSPGYLKADPVRVALFRARLKAKASDTPLVGFVWGSSARDPSRQRHYPELDEWAPVLSVPAVTFVDLQYIPSSDDRAAISQGLGVHIIDTEDVDKRNDLTATAALTAALDVVIGVSSSVTSMSAALGVPTIVINPERSWVSMIGGREAWLGQIRWVHPDPGAGWSHAMQRSADLLRHVLSGDG